MGLMARPREFDTDSALDGAIAVFREHGFEGTSAQMLVDAMGIGRQSLYAAFGDKWQLYCSAARRYGMGECAVHFDALRSGARAIEGIYAMLARSLRGAIAARVRDAQREGDVATGLDPEAIAEFLIANFAGIRVAGRGGADRATLTGLADMALRALR